MPGHYSAALRSLAVLTLLSLSLLPLLLPEKSCLPVLEIQLFLEACFQADFSRRSEFGRDQV